MKPSTLFDLVMHHKTWRTRHMRWVMQNQAGVAWRSEQGQRTHLRVKLEWRRRSRNTCRNAEAFDFDALGAKHFSDTLMVHLVRSTISPLTQKVEST